MIINKEQFLLKRPRAVKKVFVESLGGDVLISSITAKEKEDFEEWVGKSVKEGTGNIRARMISLSVVDDKGERMFSDADVAEIGNNQNSVIEPLYDEIMSFNKFGKKDREELEKNSEPTPAVDSTST